MRNDQIIEESSEVDVTDRQETNIEENDRKHLQKEKLQSKEEK